MNYPKKLVYPKRLVVVPIHRLVAEKFYGRKIGETECVHHIDGNPKNFRHENLIIINRKDHEKLSLYMKERKIHYPKFRR